MGLSTITPETRSEEFIDRIARALGSGGTSPLDTIVPETRHEEFIDRIARANGWEDTSPMASIYPETRLEEFLNRIAENTSGGVESETGEYEPEADETSIIINFANEHDTTPAFIVFADAEDTGATSTLTNLMFIYADIYKLLGASVVLSSSTRSTSGGTILSFQYRASGDSATGAVYIPTFGQEEPRDDNTIYSRYWVTEEGFKASTNNASRYWRAGRTYKWIAIWL